VFHVRWKSVLERVSKLELPPEDDDATSEPESSSSSSHPPQPKPGDGTAPALSLETGDDEDIYKTIDTERIE